MTDNHGVSFKIAVTDVPENTVVAVDDEVENVLAQTMGVEEGGQRLIPLRLSMRR